MNQGFRLLLASTLVALLSAPMRETIPLGHACFKQFSNPSDDTFFACAFEISAATTFYDQENIDSIVGDFIEERPGHCKIHHTERMVDPEMAKIDHAYRLVVTHIRCSDGS